jgi:hypothetical protein
MLRALFEYVLPLALPTAIYFAVRAWVERRAEEGHPVAKPSWWDAPWPWLGAAGIVLMLATLAVLSLTEGAPPSAVYHPPEVKGGKVRPGGFDQ